MIPLAIPNLAGNERAYLNECIDSTFVSTVGPFVNRFEQMVGEAAGYTYTVATSAGTTGLHAALIAVGVEPGDLVIIPGLSFIATANAVAHAHAQPWMLDIDSESWTLDPRQLEKALREETARDERGALRHKATGQRVAAVVPVYTLGMPADMDPIVALAREFRLPVVADGAAALGARYKGRSLGDLGADLTMFSFNGNKTVTAGGGGAVSGNDEALVKRVRHLTTTARVGADYDHDMVGFNYRMTNLQAAVGCAQMELLPRFVARKREISAFYDKSFASLSGVLPFPLPDFAESACWFAGFVLKEGDSAALRARLREKGIDARPFWKPLHFQAPFAACPRGDLSVSESVWQRIVTLPCSTGISDEELEQVAAIVIAEVGQ
ncbi:aminotransferase class I/II-fold pyridoxal phosphate-dependent enzyme [Chromobacterium sp. ASV23]|uniref:aminotransferase class I/II-fold pyridoxal phosphate-dependent enzyme n=1 Tax=Chromobacterium sp. ASV23 TaxID=2795110 RepID=UPI0018EC22B0|nr:aminotransferase class I/II-fold pyridoxal phosphate-dependent enzyme [Chromobacterium sp. ASV23]